MRVLHVAQPTEAGVAVVTAALAADQVARGWQVAVACPPEGSLAGWIAGVGAAHLAWEAGRDPGAAVASEVRRLRGLVAGHRPDLVHLHSSKAGLDGRLALRGRVATVFQPHAWSFLAVEGPTRLAAQGWERLGARWADRVIAVSEDERAVGERAGIRARWEVIPNGVDVSGLAARADRRAARALLAGAGVELAPGAPVAVCVGRLSPQKGQDALLRAWEEVSSRVPAAQLLLVGDGPDRESLGRAAPSSVRLVGAQSDVAPWLAAADVVVLPSRWEAGLPLVAMEAMAVGRSVVLTAVAGAGSLPAAAGEVVGVDDIPALAAAVTARLLDPERATAEGRAGAREAGSRYSRAEAAARVAAVYGDVLRARSGR